MGAQLLLQFYKPIIHTKFEKSKGEKLSKLVSNYQKIQQKVKFSCQDFYSSSNLGEGFFLLAARNGHSITSNNGKNPPTNKDDNHNYGTYN